MRPTGWGRARPTAAGSPPSRLRSRAGHPGGATEGTTPPTPATRCLPALAGPVRLVLGRQAGRSTGRTLGPRRVRGGHPAPWGGRAKGSGAGDPHPGELHHVGCDGPSVAAQSPTCHVPAGERARASGCRGGREKRAVDQGLEHRWPRGPGGGGEAGLLGCWAAAGCGGLTPPHTPPHSCCSRRQGRGSSWLSLSFLPYSCLLDKVTCWKYHSPRATSQEDHVPGGPHGLRVGARHGGGDHGSSGGGPRHQEEMGKVGSMGPGGVMAPGGDCLAGGVQLCLPTPELLPSPPFTSLPVPSWSPPGPLPGPQPHPLRSPLPVPFPVLFLVPFLIPFPVPSQAPPRSAHPHVSAEPPVAPGSRAGSIPLLPGLQVTTSGIPVRSPHAPLFVSGPAALEGPCFCSYGRCSKIMF